MWPAARPVMVILMRHKAFVLAPAFLLLGVLAMKFGWKPNPDLDWSVAFPLWTGAHLAYIAGNVAFGFVLVTLWRWGRDAARSPLERGAVHVLSGLGAVGLVAMIGQMVIDLLVSFEAADRAGMSAISDRYHDIPGFDAFFYGAIPGMHLGATALLLVLLAVRRRVAVWPAGLALVASLAIATQLTPLMVAGGVGLLVALAAIARAERVGARVPVGAAH
jgi:hypothetical protein